MGQWGNVVDCLPIHMVLNITSYASTDLLDLLDQASLLKHNEEIFNSTLMGKQLTTLPHWPIYPGLPYGKLYGTTKKQVTST